jgi:hypothetical protein
MVIMGRTAVVDDGEGVVVATLAGAQLDTLEPVAALTVDELDEDHCDGAAVTVGTSESGETGIEAGRERVLAYQMELGTGTMVIVTREVTDVVVDVEGPVGQVMVEVDVKVLGLELVLDGSADQLAQVLVGSADVLVEPGPVARPLQVELVQVPNVDQPVGVENVEDEVVLVDEEFDTPPTGVELELQAPPQAQDEEAELELVVVLEVVDEEAGLAGVETEELQVEEYEPLQVELVVVEVALVDVDRVLEVVGVVLVADVG